MPVYYTQDYYDMIRLYFTNGEQAAPAAIEYANLYPNRHHPNPNVIAGAVRRLRETGSVLPNHRDGGRPRRIRNLVMEDAIVAAVRNDPTLSTRSVARQLDVSHMSVHRVLKENEQYPYHYTKVQHLLPRDYQLRVNFADYYLNQVNLRPNYGSRILYTDECTFTKNGMFNTHNYHYWSHENLYLTRESSFQHRYSVNIWCGLLGDQIIGPFTLPARLNSQEYLDFLRNDLPDMLVPAEIDLEDVVLNRRAAIFMHDGAPAHSAHSCFQIAKGKPPVVGYVPFGSAPWFKYYIGGPHYPTVRSYPYKDLAKPINLWQKTLNALYYIMDDFVRNFYYMPNSQRIAERYIGHEIRPLHELEKNINFILINTHSAFEPGIPLPPNAIEIGGLHAQPVQRIADEETVTYPENIREFLDGAENGVVVISLGTNVKWKSIGPDKLKTVTLALSKLKQRILWKLDVELPFQVPNNIMVVEWMLQNEILTHKNVKAIWTHGGLLSVQEAIWKGIPVIGMPFFADQKVNVALLVHKGVAVRLDISTLSTEFVLDAFDKILYNESYTRNMKQLSSEFRDRPVPPLDSAIWWIEYAVRHPHGALESPLRSQSWMEQNLIDIYAFLFLNLIIILSVVFFLLKKLFNFCCNRVCTVSKLQKSKQM